MSIATADNVDTYVSAFKQLAAGAFQGEPSWLLNQRQQAIGHFAEVGFSSNRDEDWRLANLTPVTRRPYSLNGSGREVELAEIEQHLVPGLTGPRLVFVNGKLSPQLSRLEENRHAVHVMSLADALAKQDPVLEQHLGRYCLIEGQPFTALNTALWTEGALVHVKRSAELDQPIELVYVSTGVDGTLTNPRTLIVAESNCHASVLEYHLALGEGEYWSNGVTEVVVEPNAFLAHYWIELESKQAINVSTLRAELSRDSRMESHTVLFGGSLVRNNVHPILNGEGCDCLVNGLYIGGGNQHLDNHMRVEHAKPHCDSRQFYKGILDDHSTGVFAGRIVVHPDAQKTDAKQTNMNLLRSPDAEADSKPQLEIYADDVKCTHGATIGQIDEDAIFYLRSRGIDAVTARNILVHAFASESLERMQLEKVRDYLEGLISQRLPLT